MTDKDRLSSQRVLVRKTQGKGVHLDIKDLTLDLANRKGTLVKDFELALKRGDRFILTGPSGSGKSSVVRAIRELWKTGKGLIEIPEDANVLCLSQDVHIPSGGIKMALCAPKAEGAFTDQEMDAALHDAGLDKIRNLLPMNQAKPEYLSGLMKDYLPLALEHWSEDLSGLGVEKDTLLSSVEAYICAYAENFYFDAMKPYLTSDVKRELAKQFVEKLDDAMRQGSPVNNNKPKKSVNIERLSQDIAQYMLQASAKELQAQDEKFKKLSGGEEQKLGFARLLLHKPDIAIMDEPTSAMDSASTHDFYSKLVDRLPNTIIFGIAHDESVIPFHTLHGHLDNQEIIVRDIPQEDTVEIA